MERAYRNLGLWLLALPVVMLAGFWVPYFSLIPHFDADTTLAVHLHALVQFSWVALAVVQPLAIRAGALELHRLLGRASYLLALCIVVLAVAMMVKEFGEHRAEGLSARGAFAAEYLSFTVLALLITFYALAIVHVRRGDIAAHLRYMLCIAIGLSPAGVGRALGYLFDVRLRSSQSVALLLVDAALIALLVYDRRRPRAARPYRLALLAYLAIEAGWLLLGRPV